MASSVEINDLVRKCWPSILNPMAIVYSDGFEVVGSLNGTHFRLYRCAHTDDGVAALKSFAWWEDQ